jgi:phosphotransferase system IIB component
MQYIQYVVIVVVLLIAALVIIKASKKDFYIEANKLVEYLGGKDNILGAEVNLSRFKVTLKDVSIVNKDAIQKLGAKGIVEIDNQLKIILGSEAPRLKKYIDELKR